MNSTEAIKNKIRDLPLTHSIVIELLYLNAYSYDDTADYLKMSVARVRQLEPVSYTHLRAHETEADLVCRLLLE